MKRISRICAAVLVFLLVLILPAKPVYASGAIGDVSEFNSLSGTAKYLGDAYRDNYYLDMEETGLLESGHAILNSIANVLFSFIRWLAYAAVCVFFICFNLNLSTMFGDQINGIQEALNNSIFKPLFLLACAVVFIVLLGRLVKQDLMGALGQLAKVIGLVMLSILVVTQSSTVLTYTTGITKSVSVEIMAGVNSANGMASNITSFAAQSAGILWQNLIHEPWITMEFDKDRPSESDIEQFMTISPSNKDARERLVAERDWNCFSKNRGAEKLGFMFLYLIPFAMKAIIYMLIALVQLVFQLMAIFYVLMAPLILIISMVPGYERMLGVWLRKILESQVSILIITMIIGILIKFDQLIYEWARANSFGWLLAMVLQVALSVALFLNRNKLLGIMSTVQRGMSTPRFAANRMRMGGNAYQTVIPQGIKYGKKAGDVAWTTVKKAAQSAYHSMANLGEQRMNAYGSMHPVDSEEEGAETQGSGAARPRLRENGSGRSGGNTRARGNSTAASRAGSAKNSRRGTERPEFAREGKEGNSMSDVEGQAAVNLNRNIQQAAMEQIQTPVTGRPNGEAAASGAPSGVRRPMLHGQGDLMSRLETRLPERAMEQRQTLKSEDSQRELIEKLQTEVQREALKLRSGTGSGGEGKRTDGEQEKKPVEMMVKVEVSGSSEKGSMSRPDAAGSMGQEVQGVRTAAGEGQRPVMKLRGEREGQDVLLSERELAQIPNSETLGKRVEQPVMKAAQEERVEQPARRAVQAERLGQPVREVTPAERQEFPAERMMPTERVEQPARRKLSEERLEPLNKKEDASVRLNPYVKNVTAENTRRNTAAEKPPVRK